VTDFINLKIKSIQSFRIAHMSRVYVRIFIGVSDRTCMNICIYTVFLKNEQQRYPFSTPLKIRPKERTLNYHCWLVQK
jgi:hypothetical protein